MFPIEVFIAKQRNELARFEAHCLLNCIEVEDENEWFQKLAEFFEKDLTI